VPKQVSITREQISSYPVENFLSEAHSISELISHFAIPADDEYQTQQSSIYFRNQCHETPVPESPPKLHYQRSIKSLEILPNTIYEISPIPQKKENRLKNNQIFSFQHPIFRESAQEEQKDITFFADGHSLTTEDIALVKEQSKDECDQVPYFISEKQGDLPTPVFQGADKTNTSFRDSISIQLFKGQRNSIKSQANLLNSEEDHIFFKESLDDFVIKEEASLLKNKVQETISLNSTRQMKEDSVVYQSRHDPSLIIKESFKTNDLNSTDCQVKTMSKQSSEVNFSIRQRQEPSPTRSKISDSSFRLTTQRSAGFFGKIKGFFSGPTPIDNDQPSTK
jgi:hypothetical protein